MKFLKIFSFPINFVWKKFLPTHFARHLGVKIGRRSKIYGNVTWSTEPYMVKIGDDCHITDGVKFLIHDGAVLLFRHMTPDLEYIAPIILGNRVYVGVNATFLPGVTVGDDCIIGAGAIVTKDIPAGSVAVGCPARVIKSTTDYYRQAKEKSVYVDLSDKAKKKNS